MVDIRALRKAHKLSLSKLGEAVGITRQAVSQIELGKSKPDVETAKKLGAVLNFDWWKIYE